MKLLHIVPVASVVAACVIALSACVPTYTLVSPAPVSAARGTIRVQPTMAWNKIPRSTSDIKWEENWTRNGPLLDGLSFIGGLPDGAAIARQRKKDDQKVPVFRARMTPQDLVSMIESFYRIKAGASIFETTAVEPVTFLGKRGLQFDYTYVSADAVKRKGRSIIAIIDRRLYLMALDGAAIHYFDAALPEFEAMAASATLG